MMEKKRLGIDVPEVVAEALEAEARARMTTAAALVREALVAYLGLEQTVRDRLAAAAAPAAGGTASGEGAE